MSISLKSDNRNESYDLKTTPEVIKMYNPIGGADHPPTDITLRGSSINRCIPALRVMSSQRKLRGSAATARKHAENSNGEGLKTENSSS